MDHLLILLGFFKRDELFRKWDFRNTRKEPWSRREGFSVPEGRVCEDSRSRPILKFKGFGERKKGYWGEGNVRPCLVGRRFSVFCIHTFRKQGKRV